MPKKDKEMTEQERKYILWSTGAAIVLLLILLVWNHFNSGPKQQPATSQTKQVGAQTDLKASAVISQEVFDTSQIQQSALQQLGTDQKIVIPDIPESSLHIVANSNTSVANYMQKLGTLVQNYNNTTQNTNNNLFSPDIKASDVDAALSATSSLISSLYALSVPSDAVVFEKATINTYSAYTSLLKDAKRYKLGINTAPWPDVYAQYAVIDNATNQINTEFTKLSRKYQLK